MLMIVIAALELYRLARREVEIQLHGHARISSSASIEATARPICSDHRDGGINRLLSSNSSRASMKPIAATSRKTFSWVISSFF
jgi:hypothetical protein